MPMSVDGKSVRRPSTNYIIATRLPNFMDKRFARVIERRSLPFAPRLLVIEGANGIGTRAAELLVQPDGLHALEDARRRLGGHCTAFQVLFKVSILSEPDEGDFDRFKHIECEEVADLEPYIRLEDYTLAHRRAWAKLGCVVT
jgi:hypothetical protein